MKRIKQITSHKTDPVSLYRDGDRFVLSDEWFTDYLVIYDPSEGTFGCDGWFNLTPNQHKRIKRLIRKEIQVKPI
jgi:hypothetical protein